MCHANLAFVSEYLVVLERWLQMCLYQLNVFLQIQREVGIISLPTLYIASCLPLLLLPSNTHVSSFLQH